MKFLSFKILFLCVLLPPFLYIFSIKSVERQLKDLYASEIEDIYTGDTQPLFDGSIRLRDAISKNIDSYLQSKAVISWGVIVNLSVTTKRGTILYPEIFNEENDSLLQPDPMKIAADNYNLMNEGLLVNIDVILNHNTLLSNAILSFYIFLSLLVLFFYYRAGLDKTRIEDLEKSSKISRLMELEKTYVDNFKAVSRDREKLISEIIKIKKKLEKEKIKASKNEDEMINEIVMLEEKINENLALQEEKQEEIDDLKEKINSFEKERRIINKQKTKVLNSVRKRFKTLYKNISINERAITGFIDLEDDMKIKSEEVIHKLNENPGIVPIKRKVFGRKSRKTIQEIIFAYKGRLYFHRVKGSKIEVLAIGTKNTQTKDLEFLDSI
jgi:hypothetical protein